jgi:8-oxo-dGTP pyrophosphatase MutT (NUDIX family)/phosphohistidine phosphatase SixA
MTVIAAGVLCWREQKGKMEVLLVHRTRYKDWSFPKGKQDPGEYLPETAVREMREETGVTLRLGRKLSVITYKLPDGQKKQVHYWASKLGDKSWRKSKFKPNEEVEKLEWFSTEKALLSLSYSHDRKLLEAAISLYSQKELETRALILLRHAKATPREEWNGDESKRPLLPEGKLQAKRLVNLLRSYSPKRVVTSPWRRCSSTVEPYAKAAKRKIIERSQLTELSSVLSPRKTRSAVEALFDQTKSAMLCSHRPALPAITQTLATRAKDGAREEILAATDLKPAEFIVLRLTMGKNPKFVATERAGVD